jgi:hypothetical protein
MDGLDRREIEWVGIGVVVVMCYMVMPGLNMVEASMYNDVRRELLVRLYAIYVSIALTVNSVKTSSVRKCRCWYV